MVSMRARTCCFTGHRTIPTSQYQSVAERLEQTIVSLIRQGVIYYGSGGALGFDTMAAQTVIKLKRMYPGVKLILVLPCTSQAERWSNEAQKIMKTLKSKLIRLFMFRRSILGSVCLREIDIWSIIAVFAYVI